MEAVLERRPEPAGSAAAGRRVDDDERSRHTLRNISKGAAGITTARSGVTAPGGRCYIGGVMMRSLAALAIVCLATAGPVVGLMLLLNVRDRRRAKLLDTMWSLAPRHLRHHMVIQARVSVLPRRSLITVDMRDCERSDIWDAFARWATGLPPGVRLHVYGGFEPGVPGWRSYCLWTTTGRGDADTASRARRARLRLTPQR